MVNINVKSTRQTSNVKCHAQSKHSSEHATHNPFAREEEPALSAKQSQSDDLEDLLLTKYDAACDEFG